jgi:hypothetical protein
MGGTCIGASHQKRSRPDLSNNLAKRLFEFEGPIGTFASKIDLGFALSIYGRKTNHDLGLVRLIRNEFAHCRLPLRFQMAEVTDVCSHLQLPEWEHSASAFSFRSLPGMAEAMETEKWWDDKKNPKTRFVVVCHTIAEELFKFARANRETLRMSALTSATGRSSHFRFAFRNSCWAVVRAVDASWGKELLIFSQ